jgi:hypothetical protein
MVSQFQWYIIVEKNGRIFNVFAENEIQQKMSLIFKELKDVRGCQKMRLRVHIFWCFTFHCNKNSSGSIVMLTRYFAHSSCRDTSFSIPCLQNSVFCIFSHLITDFVTHALL